MSGYPDDHEDDPTRPYQGPLRAFERYIYQRHEVESAFGNSYVDLLAKYKEKCKECDREKRNAVLWEKEQRMSERELNGLRAAAESSTFAFAIIDGDGAVFREDLIARGEEGGGEAAHELHKELKNYLQNAPIYSNIDSISVQVVLSVEGLNRALLTSGTLQGPDVGLLARFGRGFCRAQPLFSFVDVGYGKEQADHKVRKIFELMANNIQCRCLILGGLHDNGYATFLESFRNNSKICLLETTPAAADFRKLSFSRINFPTVFRSETLYSRLTLPPGLSLPTSMPIVSPISAGSAFAPSPVGSSASPKPNTPTSLASAVQPKREPESAPNSYAAIGRAGSTPGVIDISIQKKAANTRACYQLNRADERVDVPLPRPDPSVVRALDEKRQKNGANFCNRYHLTGYCKAVSCAFQHGDRLSQAEQLALKHKTRNLVCGSSHQCRDFSCTQGHHCVSPGACYFGDTCRFAEMHGMDITPTLRVYEDGTREVV